jgi:hypothetical protein
MSHLRFDGQGAGLNRQLDGDHNNLTDYTLVCTCKSDLGPVAGFRPNEAGHRNVYCLKCQHITILDKDAKVVAYVKAPQEIIDKAAKQTVIQMSAKIGG